VSEQVWWYATRAAGLMTWSTATASVVIGLLLSTRALRARTGPWFLDLHRFLGGITVVFLAAHLITLWADSFVEFGVREIFVPGASTWKSEAIAWGIVAAYLLVAIQITSLLRSRINGRLWRVLHLLSFLAMVAGSYHAVTAGSDIDNPVTWVIAGIGSLLVIGLISMRLQRKDPDDPGPTGVSDNRAILEEMRKRLEDLPVPETTPQPQISVTPNATLPRRAPISTSLPGIETPGADAEPAMEFADDPFASVPLADDEPRLGGWAEPSDADPFRVAPVDPFRGNAQSGAEVEGDTDREHQAPTTGRFRARPFTDREAWADDGADLFDSLAESPFSSTATPATAPESELPTSPTTEYVGNPFEPVVPTPSAIQAPPPGNDGPPPLPTAIDPLTGEPDEAAYTAWLKDWLAYAERYGDEAPEDPARV
jgi:DMSO/TMAO reductase YedYZ heme-binding membrane subunit